MSLSLKISTNADAIKDASGSSFINEEGIFDVTLNFVSVSTTTNGAKQADFNITYKGNNQVIYGPTIVNTNGQPNEIGMSLLNKLGVIVGLSDGDDLDIQEETHKVGKDQKEQTFDVITDFSGAEVKLRVQREYTKYNGNIRRSLVIRNAFRADGASAAEIANNGEIGNQMQIELEKYCKGPSYRDGVTPEEAEAWETAQRNNAGKNTAPTAAITNKRTSMFSKG